MKPTKTGHWILTVLLATTLLALATLGDSREENEYPLKPLPSGGFELRYSTNTLEFTNVVTFPPGRILPVNPHLKPVPQRGAPGESVHSCNLGGSNLVTIRIGQARATRDQYLAALEEARIQLLSIPPGVFGR